MVIEYFLEWVHTASVSKRVDAAGALARAFLRNDVSLEEREDIEAALTTLTEDAAPSVRYEIAQTFGAHASAPRHIIAALANDSLDISILVLSQSPVFHDAELVQFAENGSPKQQIAIACRPWVSGKLVDAICSVSCRDAAYATLLNPAARLSDDNLQSLAERFGEDTEIRNLLTGREDLPSRTRLLLIEKLAGALGGLVSGKSWMSPEKNNRMVSESCDKASILFAAQSSDEDVRDLVRNRINEDRLNVAYLLRAVCMGNITLVAHAFSELSGVRFARVETVLTRDRQSAFRAIYDRAGLPASAFIVFQTAISTWRDLLRSKSAINQSRLPFLVTKEVLSAVTAGETEVVDDLLVLLRRLSAEAARESAKSKAVEIASREQDVSDAVMITDETAEAENTAAISFDEVEDTQADHEVAETLELVVSDPPAEVIDQSLLEELIDREISEIESLIVEEADDVSFPEVPITPATVDAGYLGSLSDEHLDQMYADIYDYPEVALAGPIARAA